MIKGLKLRKIEQNHTFEKHLNFGMLQDKSKTYLFFKYNDKFFVKII